MGPAVPATGGCLLERVVSPVHEGVAPGRVRDVTIWALSQVPLHVPVDLEHVVEPQDRVGMVLGLNTFIDAAPDTGAGKDWLASP